MPLDIPALYRRVEQMVVGLTEVGSEQQLSTARAYLRQADPDALRLRLRQRERGTAKIPWLVAHPIATLAQAYPAPQPSSDLTVVAADGSSIPPDRHSPVQYYVLNIGSATLTYGTSPNAHLESSAQLCYEESELYFDAQGKRIPIEGTRLGIHMSVQELIGLEGATRKAPSPKMALRDGSLILWNLQSEESELQNHYLSEFLSTLDRFHASNVPIASYISFPGGQDVVNSLRLMLCEVETGGCTHCPQVTEAQLLCRFMGTLWDRSLYKGLLSPGDRSDIFQSESAILNQYAEHRILFFYLNVGDEIARIEAPSWVMLDPQLIDRVHSAVFDQCRRSSQYPPYPPALIEAHEQAVISTAERQTVQELIEGALARKGIFYVRSAKDRSKRSRGV